MTVTTEMLRKALENYAALHPVNVECQECKELGLAMFVSEDWKKIEEDWISIFMDAAQKGDTPECTFMCLKYFVGVGMELQKVRSRNDGRSEAD